MDCAHHDWPNKCAPSTSSRLLLTFFSTIFIFRRSVSQNSGCNVGDAVFFFGGDIDTVLQNCLYRYVPGAPHYHLLLLLLLVCYAFGGLCRVLVYRVSSFISVETEEVTLVDTTGDLPPPSKKHVATGLADNRLFVFGGVTSNGRQALYT